MQTNAEEIDTCDASEINDEFYTGIFFYTFCERETAPSKEAPKRLSKRLSFVDEETGEDLAKIIEIENIGKAVGEKALFETLQYYGKRLIPLLEAYIDNIVISSEPDIWQSIGADVIRLVQAGIDSEEDMGELDEVMEKATYTTSCEESVHCLVQCGIGCQPEREVVVGFVLCSFANLFAQNLALVVKGGGCALILAALIDTRRVCDLEGLALEVIEKAFDNEVGHGDHVREPFIKLAASDDRFLPAVIAAMERDAPKAVTILTGILKLDKSLSSSISGVTLVDMFLDLIGNGSLDVKHQSRIIDILPELIDSTSSFKIAKAAAQTMHAFPGNIRVQMCTCKLLHDCCAPLVKPDGLSSLDCCSDIANCMKLCKAAVVQRSGCYLLHVLIHVGCDVKLETIQEVLISAIRKHGKVSGLIADAISAFAALARTHEGRHAMKVDGAKTFYDVLNDVVAAFSNESQSYDVAMQDFWKILTS